MNNEYRYRIKLAKLNELKFLSHLDWQNLVLKSLRRSGVVFALSEGFNKMPKISFSPALPLFLESECELVNFATLEPLKSTFKEDFTKSTLENIKLVECTSLLNDGRRFESLENTICWAKYSAELLEPDLLNKTLGISNFNDLRYTVEKCLSSNDLFIMKKTKKGIEKQVNYRKSFHSAEFEQDCFEFILKAGQGQTPQGIDTPSFRADEFLKYLYGNDTVFKIKRLSFFDKDLKIL